MSLVTVCIPVFNGMAHLPDTLNAIASQSHDDVRILMSVDPSVDNSLDFCREEQHRDSRITVFPQQNRLGFKNNVNFLIGRVETEFFCIIPQDDRVEPDYVSTLLEPMATNSGVALTYSDMDRGGGTRVEFQSSLSGTVHQRSIGYLARQMNHVEWRGLIRSRYLNGSHAFGAGENIDHALPLRMALQGELLRVPQVLYHKTTHTTSHTAHQYTTESGRIQRIGDALTSCLNCYETVSAGVVSNPGFGVLAKIALLLRVQNLLEMNWPSHLDDQIADLDLEFFGDLLQQRLKDLFLIHDALDKLAPAAQRYPVEFSILKAGIHLHLAIAAGGAGDRDTAAYLARVALEFDPGLACVDEFHRSVYGRFESVLEVPA